MSEEEQGKEKAHPDPSVTLEHQQCYRTRWSCRELKIDKEIGAMVEVIIKACGFDPQSATAEGMDQSRVRLRCQQCILERGRSASDDNLFPVFGWRRALKHQLECHRLQKLISWVKLPKVDACICRDQYFRRIKTGEDTAPIWLCVHCLDLPSEPQAMQFSAIRHHIIHQHNVSDPKQCNDYYAEFDAALGFATGTWTQTHSTTHGHAADCFMNINSIQRLF